LKANVKPKPRHKRRRHPRQRQQGVARSPDNNKGIYDVTFI
jgi:hypothetical protein